MIPEQHLGHDREPARLQVIVAVDAAPIEFSMGRMPCVALPLSTIANTSSKLSHGSVWACELNRSAAASLYAPGSP